MHWYCRFLLLSALALSGCQTTTPDLEPVAFSQPVQKYPPVGLVINDGHVRVFTEVVVSGYVSHANHTTDPVPQAIYDQFVESQLFERVVANSDTEALRIDLLLVEDVVQSSGEYAAGFLSAATIGVIPTSSTLNYRMDVAVSRDSKILGTFSYDIAIPRRASVLNYGSHAGFKIELKTVRRLVSEFLKELVGSGVLDEQQTLVAEQL